MQPMEMTPQKVTMQSNKPCLFIDGSYYIFHRYYAVYNWFRLAKHETPVEDLFKDTVYVEKFDRMFVKCIADFVKYHELEWRNVVFFKDSPREDLWRKQRYGDYKANRPDKLASFNSEVFHHCYSNILPGMAERYGVQIMGEAGMEADDLIAIAKNRIRGQDGSVKIVIVTNDNDYIQLYDDHTHIINLKGKHLRDRVPMDPATYLQMKIIGGDPSDCIPPIAKKIGPKTAEKLARDKNALEAYFNKTPEARVQYQFNKELIDMALIPDELVARVQEKIECI